MVERTRNYWLHRITGGENALPVAWQLLYNKDADEHYLSIGWSELSSDILVKEAKAGNRAAVRSLFEAEKYSLSYSAWCLIRFIKDMQPGDYVVVPSWGKFSVYEIEDDVVLSNESADGIHFVDWDGNEPQFKDGYLYTQDDKTIDLGFYRKVKPVEVDIPRAEYAEADLISRMKIRQTNADINDLWEQVEKAIVAKRADKPINLKSNILENIVENTFEQIKKTLDADKFEKLVEWYLRSLGATWTTTPAKNGSTTEEGDADRVAYFEKLKLVVMVQAKRHEDTTSDWAVQQITAYRDNNKPSDDYSTIMWVISTCDKFSEEAIKKAKDNGVRLIDGREFAKLILESGLNGMYI